MPIHHYSYPSQPPELLFQSKKSAPLLLRPSFSILTSTHSVCGHLSGMLISSLGGCFRYAIMA
jgi:hypothetical protein